MADAAHIPTVADVAAILHQRLNAGGGNVAQTFDTTTTPTAVQVQAIIDMQAPLAMIDFGDVSTAGGMACSTADDIRTAIRALIAARAAAVIELSYFPQDTVGGDTADAFWRRIVEVDTPRVVQAARECKLGEIVPGGGTGEGGVAIKPRFQFNVGSRVGNRPY